MLTVCSNYNHKENRNNCLSTYKSYLRVRKPNPARKTNVKPIL